MGQGRQEMPGHLCYCGQALRGTWMALCTLVGLHPVVCLHRQLQRSCFGLESPPYFPHLLTGPAGLGLRSLPLSAPLVGQGGTGPRLAPHSCVLS